MAQINDIVFIDKLNQFGKIEEIDENGRITKVTVTTKQGLAKTIITTELIVVVIGLIEKIIFFFLTKKRNKKAEEAGEATVSSLLYSEEDIV